jgi:hypothetical protein
MSEEKVPYHAGGWSPPDYSSRDFLLELYIPGHDTAVESATTIVRLLGSVQWLVNGTSFTMKGVFNGHIIGSGDYRKEGNELIVVQESGALVGIFAPLIRAASTGVLCAKCKNIIVGEPNSAPSYEGPLCGSCAWEEWLAEHE